MRLAFRRMSIFTLFLVGSAAIFFSTPFQESLIAQTTLIEDATLNSATLLDRLSKVELPKLENDALRKLIANGNDHQSILCRWELQRRTASTGVTKRDEVMQFLGFVEAKLKCSVPKSWKNTLLARIDGTSRDERNSIIKELVERSREVAASLDSPLVANEDAILFPINHGDNATHLPIRLQDAEHALKRQGEVVNFLRSPDSVFIADLSIGYSAFQLIAVDRAKPTVKWVAEVFGEPSPHVGGRPIRFVELFCDDNRVFVYGCGNILFLEVFEKKSGKAMIRFSAFQESSLPLEKR